MKRYGHLFEKICSFENLVKAAKKAQRGKRFKSSTSEFNLRLEDELLTIQEELQQKTYQIGQYKHFYIFDPKKRLISALPYRDRVIQHALCNVIEPIFDRTFVPASYACRRNKGSHRAVSLFSRFCRSNSYVLKCDIKSYFASIDHDLLYELIASRSPQLQGDAERAKLSPRLPAGRQGLSLRGHCPALVSSSDITSGLKASAGRIKLAIRTMKTSEFDFYVPPELIAHEPADQRDHSRLILWRAFDCVKII